MILIGISGGVDSMVLAHLYKNENIVLAFVNYNLRNDTHIDQSIVEEFAFKNNIILEKLIISEIPKKGNFEDWARKIRYDFFKKIYDKYNCKKLLLAHHKDDFLETCIMQNKRNNQKKFYGIKEHKILNNMIIERPFINKYWKSQIYEIALKENIEYHEDYTNLDVKYERNNIRNQLLLKSKNEKERILWYYINLNKKNKKVIEEINTTYLIWKEKKFNLSSFKDFDYKDELIKKLINKDHHKINLNKNIINNIILFINSSNKKNKFILSNNHFLTKNNNKIELKCNKI